MVANDGASMPAPLAIPPTVQLPGWCSATCLGTVSVVMIACAASSPPLSPPAISCTIVTAHRRALCPSATGRRSNRWSRPRPRWLRSRSPRPTTRRRPPPPWRGRPGTRRSGACVGAAGVEDHRAQLSGGQYLLGPQHRCGLDLITGEHPSGRVIGSFIEDQCQVASPDALMPAAMPAARNPAGAVTPCSRSNLGAAAGTFAGDSVTARPRPPKGLLSPANPAPGSSTALRHPPCP